jgi:N-glycosylase/DNA lyase
MPSKNKRHSVLAKAGQIDIRKTLECGQCFRWNEQAPGVYTGVALGRVLSLWESEGFVLCSCGPDELPLWREYFDLEADYNGLRAGLTSPEYLRKCADFGAGIRILRQEPWEALCSFIISQCNNIPRIKAIVERLCSLFGTELGPGRYAFPSAETVAKLSLSELEPLRAGYRAQYILNAARAACDGTVPLDTLALSPADEVFKRVTAISGIGTKVANCFMLYGLHMMERFPVDVWMKRALKEHFPPDFEPSTLGAASGLAQQYIFYYTRSGGS